MIANEHTSGKLLIGGLIAYIIFAIIVVVIDYKMTKHITKVYFIEYLIKDREYFYEENLKLALEQL